MDAKTKKWIKAVLANDEVSSDEELLEYFVKEGGLTPEEALNWLGIRSEYLRNIICDLEPSDEVHGSPYVLPTFNGYTVDRRLHQFRKAEYGKCLEFISFDSPEGKKLLQEMDALVGKVKEKRVGK